MTVGEPFNPSRKVCGFYPPDVVGRNTELKLTDGQKRLYERGVRWAGRNGEFWYGFDTIAEALGKSVRQVKDDIATLEEKGLMAHVRRRRQVNRYRFLWHHIFEVQPTAYQDDLEVQDSNLEVQDSVKKWPLKVQPTALELCPLNYVSRISSICASDDARVDVGSALPTTPRSADGYRPEWFEQWWAIYWRRVSRKRAQKAFQAHVKTQERFEQVMAATRAQTPTMNAREPAHRPYGASWLNDERWNDEPSLPATAAKKPPERQASQVERLKARWEKRIADGERPI